MAGTGRNLALVGLMAAVIAATAIALGSAMWASAVAALLALAGVVLLRGNRWRTGSLLAAAVALSLALLDAFAGLLTPTAYGAELERVTEPGYWPPYDPVLGFRPKPDSQAVHTATFGAEKVYRVTYNFDADGARKGPAAPAGADTYLFVGDSFTFGQGLTDDQHLAAQFAKANDYKVSAVNLGVPGNSPNQMLRAFETGLLDAWQKRPVKAVVFWIIPAQLARVTGDGTWLWDTPRYVLEDGKLRHTGTFNEYRWTRPWVGLKALLGEQFAFIDAIGREQRQAEQVELYVAMLARLQAFVREKFKAPLVLAYSWPDEKSPTDHGASEYDQTLLVGILARIRKLGMPMVRVDTAVGPTPVSQLLIPYDGHPSALQNELVAQALKKQLIRD